jgi:hypothetical protein
MSDEPGEAGHPPPPGYEHAFAIVRVDFFNDTLLTLANFIEYPRARVVKVLWDQQKAQQEAKRLNELNSAKGAVYFTSITRVERRHGP